MFKNLIITIFTILVTASYTLADPIPVFCLAGWIDACKGYTSADAYYYATTSKTEYNRSGNTVHEYNYNTTNNTKYTISDNKIYGYDYGTTNNTKYTLHKN